jgi:hypothetical protein
MFQNVLHFAKSQCIRVIGYIYTFPLLAHEFLKHMVARDTKNSKYILFLGEFFF